MTTEVSVVGAGRSVVSYRISGRDYPLKTNRQCKVCMSPYRFEIEEEITLGRAYGKIAEALPSGSDLTSRNVMDHYRNGHLPLEVATSRGIVDAGAQRVGKRIEENVGSLVDGMILSEVVVQRTFERIARGEIEPDIANGLAAAKFLADMGEYDQGGADVDAMTEAFMVYMETLEKMLPAEQLEEFGRRLAGNPVLQALIDRFEGREVQEEETVAGKVVADTLSGELDSR